MEPILVTKPYFPPIEEYRELLDKVWDNKWLTNEGPLLQDLSAQLKSYLSVPNISLVNNGTTALQIIIKALGLRGEIITTPFSYIATTTSIIWEDNVAVFADIDVNTFNIDPDKIEEKINSKTCAILVTHCFGIPCDIDRIEEIAKKHDLPVIYDAAHCFGGVFREKSIFSYGDVSCVSFHATKLYHTIEGGAVFSSDRELMYRVDKMKNFGHNGEGEYDGLGINGKLSEVHAAMGIANLRHIDEILASRKSQYRHYKEELSGLGLTFQKIPEECEPNYSYFPVVFENESEMTRVRTALERENIYTRRYFHPSLSHLPYLPEQHTPKSDDIASRVLCLPMYLELSELELDKISSILKSQLTNN